MKRFLISAAALVLCALPLMAITYPGDYNYSGTVNFDKGCIWSIQGTRVTATASQLNTASTIGITNATLTITRQVVASATNGTVAITITPQYGTFTNLNAATNPIVQVLMTNVTCTAIFTPQAASVAAVTNVVITTQHP
jgi:hypothetical protein